MKSRNSIGFITVFTVILSTGLFYVITDLNNVPPAHATGGAFTYTKHGGNTNIDSSATPLWCDPGPCGVNRAIGGEVGGFYFQDPGAEAGQYPPAECNHCHEPHNSFGMSEPPPTLAPYDADAGTPDDYLLFGDNDNDICWYCHNNIQTGDIANPQGYGYWGFYQGQTVFTNSIHGSTVGNFEWPGVTTALSGVTAVFPRNFNRNTANVNTGGCVNCHSPHGLRGGGIDATNYDISTVPTASQTTSANKDVATNYVIPRQLIAWEEALCLNCHMLASPTGAPDIKTQVERIYNHPIKSTTLAGRHTVREYRDVTSTGQLNSIQWNSAKLGTDTRHVECVDCHNPHVVQAIASDPNRTGMTQAGRAAEMLRIRGPLLGQWGVKPAAHEGKWASLSAGFFGINWPTAATTGWPQPTSGNVTSYAKVYFNDTTSNDMYEAYLCLKCHSYFAWGSDGVQSVTTGSGTYTQTDVTRDFNPNNYGYHPVFNHGQNRPGDTDGSDINNTITACAGGNNPSFNSAFNTARGIYCDSYLTCTDCHNSSSSTDSRGPHGSAKIYILRQSEMAGSADSDLMCHNCHLEATYGDQGSTCTPAASCNYSRVDHMPAQGIVSYPLDLARKPGNGMAPIGCMNCHGGGRLGGLHGSNEPVGIAGANCAACTTERGKRLVNGAEWQGWGTNVAGASPSCNLKGKSGLIAGYTDYTNCERASSGASGSIYNYSYAPTHYDP